VATYFDAINDGETTLANTLLASETVQIIVTDGSKLPTGGVGTSGFILKLEDTIGTVEYILCSSRSGNTVYIATDGRGYEGTDAIQWLSGSYIKNVFTKATKDEISENIGDLTYTEENYVVSDESVSQSINSLDIQLKNASNGVGNLTYTEQNYVVNGESLTESIDGLDIQLKDTDDKIGTLSSLNTTDKTSIVGAINSHLADYASLFTTNADAKNSIYRGKYLGNAVTAEQYTAISSGTFTDLYIGDYWTIGGVNWRIAAFNYYRNTGDTNVPGNHITIVPDTQLYTHVMNDTNITTGGYTGSKMYTAGLEQAKSTIRSIFGTHLIKHRRYLCNAVIDGKASAGAWIDSEVDLMNEIMVYGAMVNSSGILGLYNVGVEKSQLPLFALNPRMINTRQSYWLRDVVSASNFALVYGDGSASGSGASFARGVRPAFSIS
jgi:hypothetical protein